MSNSGKEQSQDGGTPSVFKRLLRSLSAPRRSKRFESYRGDGDRTSQATTASFTGRSSRPDFWRIITPRSSRNGASVRSSAKQSRAGIGSSSGGPAPEVVRATCPEILCPRSASQMSEKNTQMQREQSGEPLGEANNQNEEQGSAPLLPLMSLWPASASDPDSRKVEYQITFAAKAEGADASASQMCLFASIMGSEGTTPPLEFEAQDAGDSVLMRSVDVGPPLALILHRPATWASSEPWELQAVTVSSSRGFMHAECGSALLPGFSVLAGGFEPQHVEGGYATLLSAIRGALEGHGVLLEGDAGLDDAAMELQRALCASMGMGLPARHTESMSHASEGDDGADSQHTLSSGRVEPYDGAGDSELELSGTERGSDHSVEQLDTYSNRDQRHGHGVAEADFDGGSRPQVPSTPSHTSSADEAVDQHGSISLNDGKIAGVVTRVAQQVVQDIAAGATPEQRPGGPTKATSQPQDQDAAATGQASGLVGGASPSREKDALRKSTSRHGAGQTQPRQFLTSAANGSGSGASQLELEVMQLSDAAERLRRTTSPPENTSALASSLDADVGAQSDLQRCASRDQGCETVPAAVPAPAQAQPSIAKGRALPKAPSGSPQMTRVLSSQRTRSLNRYASNITPDDLVTAHATNQYETAASKAEAAQKVLELKRALKDWSSGNSRGRGSFRSARTASAGSQARRSTSEAQPSATASAATAPLHARSRSNTKHRSRSMTVKSSSLKATEDASAPKSPEAAHSRQQSLLPARTASAASTVSKFGQHYVSPYSQQSLARTTSKAKEESCEPQAPAPSVTSRSLPPARSTTADKGSDCGTQEHSEDKSLTDFINTSMQRLASHVSHAPSTGPVEPTSAPSNPGETNDASSDIAAELSPASSGPFHAVQAVPAPTDSHGMSTLTPSSRMLSHSGGDDNDSLPAAAAGMSTSDGRGRAMPIQKSPMPEMVDSMPAPVRASFQDRAPMPLTVPGSPAATVTDRATWTMSPHLPYADGASQSFMLAALQPSTPHVESPNPQPISLGAATHTEPKQPASKATGNATDTRGSQRKVVQAEVREPETSGSLKYSRAPSETSAPLTPASARYSHAPSDDSAPCTTISSRYSNTQSDASHPLGKSIDTEPQRLASLDEHADAEITHGSGGDHNGTHNLKLASHGPEMPEDVDRAPDSDGSESQASIHAALQDIHENLHSMVALAAHLDQAEASSDTTATPQRERSGVDVAAVSFAAAADAEPAMRPAAGGAEPEIRGRRLHAERAGDDAAVATSEDLLRISAELRANKERVAAAVQALRAAIRTASSPGAPDDEAASVIASEISSTSVDGSPADAAAAGGLLSRIQSYATELGTLLGIEEDRDTTQKLPEASMLRAHGSSSPRHLTLSLPDAPTVFRSDACAGSANNDNNAKTLDLVNPMYDKFKGSYDNFPGHTIMQPNMLYRSQQNVVQSWSVHESVSAQVPWRALQAAPPAGLADVRTKVAVAAGVSPVASKALQTTSTYSTLGSPMIGAAWHGPESLSEQSPATRTPALQQNQERSAASFFRGPVTAPTARDRTQISASERKGVSAPPPAEFASSRGQATAAIVAQTGVQYGAKAPAWRSSLAADSTPETPPPHSRPEQWRTGNAGPYESSQATERDMLKPNAVLMHAIVPMHVPEHWHFNQTFECSSHRFPDLLHACLELDVLMAELAVRSAAASSSTTSARSASSTVHSKRGPVSLVSSALQPQQPRVPERLLRPSDGALPDLATFNTTLAEQLEPVNKASARISGISGRRTDRHGSVRISTASTRPADEQGLTTTIPSRRELELKDATTSALPLFNTQSLAVEASTVALRSTLDDDLPEVSELFSPGSGASASGARDATESGRASSGDDNPSSWSGAGTDAHSRQESEFAPNRAEESNNWSVSNAPALSGVCVSVNLLRSTSEAPAADNSDHRVSDAYDNASASSFESRSGGALSDVRGAWQGTGPQDRLRTEPVPKAQPDALRQAFSESVKRSSEGALHGVPSSASSAYPPSADTAASTQRQRTLTGSNVASAALAQARQGASFGGSSTATPVTQLAGSLRTSSSAQQGLSPFQAPEHLRVMQRQRSNVPAASTRASDAEQPSYGASHDGHHGVARASAQGTEQASEDASSVREVSDDHVSVRMQDDAWSDVSTTRTAPSAPGDAHRPTSDRTSLKSLASTTRASVTGSCRSSARPDPGQTARRDVSRMHLPEAYATQQEHVVAHRDNAPRPDSRAADVELAAALAVTATRADRLHVSKSHAQRLPERPGNFGMRALHAVHSELQAHGGYDVDVEVLRHSAVLEGLPPDVQRGSSGTGLLPDGSGRYTMLTGPPSLNSATNSTGDSSKSASSGSKTSGQGAVASVPDKDPVATASLHDAHEPVIVRTASDTLQAGLDSEPALSEGRTSNVLLLPSMGSDCASAGSAVAPRNQRTASKKIEEGVTLQALLAAQIQGAVAASSGGSDASQAAAARETSNKASPQNVTRTASHVSQDRATKADHPVEYEAHGGARPLGSPQRASSWGSELSSVPSSARRAVAPSRSQRSGRGSQASCTSRGDASTASLRASQISAVPIAEAEMRARSDVSDNVAFGAFSECHTATNTSWSSFANVSRREAAMPLETPAAKDTVQAVLATALTPPPPAAGIAAASASAGSSRRSSGRAHGLQAVEAVESVSSETFVPSAEPHSASGSPDAAPRWSGGQRSHVSSSRGSGSACVSATLKHQVSAGSAAGGDVRRPSTVLRVSDGTAPSVQQAGTPTANGPGGRRDSSLASSESASATGEGISRLQKLTDIAQGAVLTLDETLPGGAGAGAEPSLQAVPSGTEAVPSVPATSALAKPDPLVHDVSSAAAHGGVDAAVLASILRGHNNLDSDVEMAQRRTALVRKVLWLKSVRPGVNDRATRRLMVAQKEWPQQALLKRAMASWVRAAIVCDLEAIARSRLGWSSSSFSSSSASSSSRHDEVDSADRRGQVRGTEAGRTGRVGVTASRTARGKSVTAVLSTARKSNHPYLNTQQERPVPVHPVTTGQPSATYPQWGYAQQHAILKGQGHVNTSPGSYSLTSGKRSRAHSAAAPYDRCSTPAEDSAIATLLAHRGSAERGAPKDAGRDGRHVDMTATTLETKACPQNQRRAASTHRGNARSRQAEKRAGLSAGLGASEVPAGRHVDEICSILHGPRAHESMSKHQEVEPQSRLRPQAKTEERTKLCTAPFVRRVTEDAARSQRGRTARDRLPAQPTAPNVRTATPHEQCSAPERPENRRAESLTRLHGGPVPARPQEAASFIERIGGGVTRRGVSPRAGYHGHGRFAPPLSQPQAAFRERVGLAVYPSAMAGIAGIAR